MTAAPRSAQERAPLREALELARSWGDPVMIAEALCNAGMVELDVGDPRTAREMFQSALSALGERDPEMRAYIIQNRARLLAMQGALDEARQCLEEVDAYVRGHGPASLGVDLLLDMASLAVATEGVAPARALVAESLKRCQQVGSREGCVSATVWLGYLDRAAGRFEDARERLEHGLESARELGDGWSTAAALVELASLAFAVGEHTRAAELIGAALAMLRAPGSTAEVARAIALQGRIASARGDDDTAGRCYEESLALLRETGALAESARVPCDRALARYRAGDVAAAWRGLAEGLGIARRSGDRRRLVNALETAAELFLAEDQCKQAIRLAAAADAQRKQMGMPRPPVDRKRLAPGLRTARRALGASVASSVAAGGRRLAIDSASDELAALVAVHTASEA